MFRLLSQISVDPRETGDLFQRLSVMIQRFNAIAFQSTYILPVLDVDNTEG